MLLKPEALCTIFCNIIHTCIIITTYSRYCTCPSLQILYIAFLTSLQYHYSALYLAYLIGKSIQQFHWSMWFDNRTPNTPILCTKVIEITKSQLTQQQTIYSILPENQKIFSGSQMLIFICSFEYIMIQQRGQVLDAIYENSGTRIALERYLERYFKVRFVIPSVKILETTKSCLGQQQIEEYRTNRFLSNNQEFNVHKNKYVLFGQSDA